ncbi:hypothetical protein RRG08_055445 [Elysia crispata]|uniref:Uncharacterized protein n=1 Tax=Elysia crispata TaxID=231223 RepID=A0AAE1ABD8_9GAST|nr:hypothetical protein RRG08_055445 [Elysia crispata]
MLVPLKELPGPPSSRKSGSPTTKHTGNYESKDYFSSTLVILVPSLTIYPNLQAGHRDSPGGDWTLTLATTGFVYPDLTLDEPSGLRPRPGAARGDQGKPSRSRASEVSDTAGQDGGSSLGHDKGKLLPPPLAHSSAQGEATSIRTSHSSVQGEATTSATASHSSAQGEATTSATTSHSSAQGEATTTTTTTTTSHS